MKKHKVLAMLLAGGQGTRLRTLTKDIAKPAVPFGGKYRIIDFPLSNAANSGIMDIGVLTQYKHLRLNEHVGNGSNWDFDRNTGGLRILAPFTDEIGGRWYKGTANAIYENISFIDNIKPNYILVLSGDHIYKMDYRKMLKFHQEKKAQATLSVVNVPEEEIYRFGIMETDKDNRIVKFLEKPKVANSTLASMGVYIFNWPVLREYLMKDIKNPNSSNDFGKDIIPSMMEDGIGLYAYVFNDYWKDVGTVKSYWEANMDLLSDDNTLNLYDRSWRIFTKNRNLPPQHISDTAEVKNSLINEGCFIEGKLERCVLFNEVRVRGGACAYNSVILSDVTIEEGAHVYNAVVMEGVTIKKGQTVGEKDSDKVYLVSCHSIEEIDK